MYSNDYVDVYAAIHASRGWDWRAEAEDIAAEVRRHNPDAGSLLDVACGTGNHLAEFSRLFERTAGVDLSAGMRSVAARTSPDSTVFAGDMRTFDVPGRFDAVTCLSYSIGYMRTVEELHKAIARMTVHLAPGGVLVVEPWWSPETFLDHYVSAGLHQEDGRAISRVSYSERIGSVCRMTVHLTVADHTGIRSFTEYEMLTLFRDGDYETAFRAAGLTVEMHQRPATGRRRLVGVLNR
ncbi:class I SAM-dependent methyltransferase [Nocardia transvalensis]|nr:class I SAM-dependent methyltransferase [Nocardia transvalensis]